MAMLTRLTTSGTTTVAPGSPKALQRLQNRISAFFWQSHQRKCTQLDSLDCFTNDLVTRKTQKWEGLRDILTKKQNSHEKVVNVKLNKSNESTTTSSSSSSQKTNSFTQNVGLMSKGMMSDLQALRSPELGLDIRSLSQPQLDNLLLATLEVKNKVDFLYLIRQCIRWQQLPSNEVTVSCLKYLSQLSKLELIDALAEILRNRRHPFSRVYADLAPFKAIAFWNNGNADMAIVTLHRSYGECIATDQGRSMARAAFRAIVEETLGKSPAIYVVLMDVARAIHKDYKDVFILACVWKQSFASDWQAEKISASELFAHYKDLQELVERRAGTLCSSFLSHHNVDAVHRLIEVFLEYKKRNACAICMSQLFNYQYLRKDLRACAEIVKSCSELQMPLSELQNEQFLSLFLDQSEPIPRSYVSQAKIPKAPKIFKYNF